MIINVKRIQAISATAPAAGRTPGERNAKAADTGRAERRPIMRAGTPHSKGKILYPGVSDRKVHAVTLNIVHFYEERRCC